MSTLDGIRIIDLSMGWAGPLATRHLADMGADVIKIESCERFDWWRSWEATPEWIDTDGAEKSVSFNMVNRNKRAITLDLEDPEGRDLLLQLVARSHAVVENFSGDVLPKLQLGYEVFREVKPDIILLSMPAFGTTGPWAKFRAYGSTVEHSSGLPHLSGNAEDPPLMLHVAYGDPIGGLNGSAALLTALRHQARTGEGQFVDLSQTEGLIQLGAQSIIEYSATGIVPRRRGNFSDEFAPHGVYPCAGEDAWILIQIPDETTWQALVEIADHEPLNRFGNFEDRVARASELDAVMANWTHAHDGMALMIALQARGIPAAITRRYSELLEREPYFRERGFWQWMDREVVGSQPNPSPPWRINGKPVRLDRPAPTLGQHNTEVLSDILNLDEPRLKRLRESGVIGEKPRMSS